jgi:hypothetical protein
VIGDGGICGVGPGDPFPWQEGTLYDLQALAGPTGLRLTEAVNINSAGEIARLGVAPDGSQHVVLLVPASVVAGEGLTSNVPAATVPVRSNSIRFGSAQRMQVGPVLHALQLRGYRDRTA